MSIFERLLRRDNAIESDAPAFTYKDDPGYRSGVDEPLTDQSLYYTALAQVAAYIWNDAAMEPGWYVKTPDGSDGMPRQPTPGEAVCQAIIDDPNPILTWQEMVGRIAASVRVLGKAYVLKAQPNGRATTALWPISVFDMHFDRARGVYTRTDVPTNERERVELDWQATYPRDRVIEFRRMASEESPFGAEYPLSAAADYLTMERYAAQRASKQAKRFGAGTILTPDGHDVDDPTMGRQLEQLESAIKRLLDDPKREASTTYLPFMVKAQQLGWPLKDLLDNDWIRSVPEARAGGIFGIPPILMFTALGLTSGTYANAQQFRRDFAERSVLPTLTAIGNRLTRDLLREFSPDSEVTYRRDEISALFETPVEKAQRLEIMARNGWLSLDQILDELGYDRLPDGQGDIRQVPAGLLWVPTDDLVGGGDDAEIDDDTEVEVDGAVTDDDDGDEED